MTHSEVGTRLTPSPRMAYAQSTTSRCTPLGLQHPEFGRTGQTRSTSRSLPGTYNSEGRTSPAELEAVETTMLTLVLLLSS